MGQMSLLDWQRPGFHRRSRFPASYCSFGGQKGSAAQWFHSSFWRWQEGSTWSCPCAPAALWSHGRWQSHHRHCGFRETQHQYQGMRRYRSIQARPANQGSAPHRLLWQQSWSSGKNSSVSDAACGGGGSRNTQPRFSLMKPEPPHSARWGAGKPVSHHHIQVWRFWRAGCDRAGHVYRRGENGAAPHMEYITYLL